MSDEANVNESSSEQPEEGATTVSDAILEREISVQVVDESPEAVDPADLGLEGPVIEEPPLTPFEGDLERKEKVRGQMRQTARDNQARKNALKTAHLEEPAGDGAE